MIVSLAIIVESDHSVPADYLLLLIAQLMH